MSRWALDPAEVDAFEMSGRSSGRRRAALSRALDVSGCQIRLTHRPTGIDVAGEVPEGHYSRAEMTRLKEDLRARLLAELEQRVARHLRIPGRRSRKLERRPTKRGGTIRSTSPRAGAAAKRTVPMRREHPADRRRT